ncbi:hypothetical protein L0Y49_03455 [bacterium]|nr:hypothetical protein [bacterium]
MDILLCAFIVWYLYFSFEYMLNHCMAGRNQFLAVFELYAVNVLRNIPGGMKRKTEFIRNLAHNSKYDSILGDKRRWNFGEIQEHNLYRECAEDVFKSPLAFWFKSAVVIGVGVMIGYGLRGIMIFLKSLLGFICGI